MRDLVSRLIVAERFCLLVLIAVMAASCGTNGGRDTATNPTVEPAATVDTAEVEPTTTPPAAEPTKTPPPIVAATPTAAPTPTAVADARPASRPTIDDLLARETPLSIAHAGGDQEAPHSTMFAFKEAVAAGADVLEIDVQLSGDGYLIVQHDATVDRTTNETGAVLDSTLDELQALDNAYWFALECWRCADLPDASYLYRGVRTGVTEPPAGYTADDFRIVTFRELVAEFPQMPFDIEIKGEAGDALAVVDVLAAEIAELGLTESVVVVAFEDSVVAAFEAAAPGVDTSPGTEELAFWILANVPLEGHRIVQVPPVFDGLEVFNTDLVAKAVEAGVEVWVWPNDAAAQENSDFYRELLEIGADGIIAGRPNAMESAR